MSKVASIVGSAGMISDDGRALSYYFQTYLNEWGGKGFYKEGMVFDTQPEAEAYCAKLGYEIINTAWA